MRMCNKTKTVQCDVSLLRSLTIAKLTVQLDRAEMRQLMQMAIRERKPLWDVLNGLVKQGLANGNRRRIKRRKVVRRRAA